MNLNWNFQRVGGLESREALKRIHSMGKVWTFSENTQFDKRTVESGFLKLLIFGTSRYLVPKVSSLS